jgi:hypothetical protein
MSTVCNPYVKVQYMILLARVTTQPGNVSKRSLSACQSNRPSRILLTWKTSSSGCTLAYRTPQSMADGTDNTTVSAPLSSVAYLGSASHLSSLSQMSTSKLLPACLCNASRAVDFVTYVTTVGQGFNFYGSHCLFHLQCARIHNVNCRAS